MEAREFIEYLEETFGIKAYFGVPDSLLKPFISEIMEKYSISTQHVIAANEGNAVAMAAGYHMVTGQIACVYMQNSGQGNMVNPYASLLAPEVYKIPCVFVIGWRGQPGIKDEPQHIYQGKITTELMDLLEIESMVLTKDISREELSLKTEKFKNILKAGKSVAFVVEKNGLKSSAKPVWPGFGGVSRENAIRELIKVTGKDIVVSTTGKTSRELFELREKNGQLHQSDFLTVGSMGHCSSIALEIALQKKNQKVWCIDGDGAALMHMGAMAVIGANAPKNMVHVLLNNRAHETVGGMPTVANKLDFGVIARGCGYPRIFCAESPEEIQKAAREARTCNELVFLEIKVSLGAREDLGRPTTTAEENKQIFMQFLKEN